MSQREARESERERRGRQRLLVSASCEGIAVCCLNKRSDSPCMLRPGGTELYDQVGCTDQSPDWTTLEPDRVSQPERTTKVKLSKVFFPS